MLEGKELEGNIGKVGSYSVDVDMKGNVSIVAGAKEDVDGADVNVNLAVNVHILVLLEKLVAKTPQTWDDKLVAELKLLLGLIG